MIASTSARSASKSAGSMLDDDIEDERQLIYAPSRAAAGVSVRTRIVLLVSLLSFGGAEYTRAGSFQGSISTSTTRSAEGLKSGFLTSTAWPFTRAPRPDAI